MIIKIIIIIIESKIGVFELRLEIHGTNLTWSSSHHIIVSGFWSTISCIAMIQSKQTIEIQPFVHDFVWLMNEWMCEWIHVRSKHINLNVNHHQWDGYEDEDEDDVMMMWWCDDVMMMWWCDVMM